MKLDAHFGMLPLRAFRRDPRGHIMPQGGKGGGGDAPAPDPSIGEAQKQMSSLADEQYEDYKTNVWPVIQQQATAQQANSDRVVAQSQQIADSLTAQAAIDRETQRQQNAIAAEQYARYKSTFQPVEDSIVNDAMTYNTEGSREQIASSAIGDVKTAFDGQRTDMARNAQAYGIDPTSGAYQSGQQSSGTLEAATSAAAATRARDAAVQLGWAKKMDAIGLGRGVFTNQATSTALGLNAGSGATAASSGALGAGAAGLAAGNVPISNATTLGSSYSSGYGGSAGIYGSSGNLGAQSYNTQVSAWNAQQQANAQSSAGMGSAIGMIGGAALKKWMPV